MVFPLLGKWHEISDFLNSKRNPLAHHYRKNRINIKDNVPETLRVSGTPEIYSINAQDKI